jgi:tRNA(Arg) A34 adenosine deaminase TadA
VLQKQILIGLIKKEAAATYYYSVFPSPLCSVAIILARARALTFLQTNRVQKR